MVDNYGHNALYYAKQNGHKHTIKYLKSKGLETIYNHTYLKKLSYEDKKQALLDAAERGDNKTIDILVKECNTDLNYKDRDGRNVLLWATEKGHTSTIDHLVQNHKIDINSTNKYGMNALLWATYNSKNNMIDHLVQNHKMDISSGR